MHAGKRRHFLHGPEPGLVACESYLYLTARCQQDLGRGKEVRQQSLMSAEILSAGVRKVEDDEIKRAFQEAHSV
jgi:hypothetical protein